MILKLATLHLALSALAAVGSAQSVFQRYRGPIETVRLDVETGVLQRGSAATAPRAAETVATFENLDFSGFIAVDTGSCFCEWFTPGVKGVNRSASELMTSFVMAYCSSAKDTSSGGPGGTAAIGFYEGYRSGGWAPTTTVAVLTLTGLPAHTGSSSFFGGFSCYTMTIELGALVCFDDGPIGYSWKFLDGTGTGTLAQTWPFLACVQSCSGLSDPQTPHFKLDQYCPPGFLRSVFSCPTAPLGGGAPYFGSVALEIREASDCAATLMASMGQGLNVDVLTAPPAVVGEAWNATVSLLEPTHPAVGVSVLLFSPTALPTGPRISLFGGPVTELLVDPANLSQPCPVAPYAGTTSVLCGGVVIPAEFSLISAPWNVQVLSGTPASGMTLSNAVGGKVGTF